MLVMTLVAILFLVGIIAVTLVASARIEKQGKENTSLREQNRTLEERNESLDRQNQLMERQYNLFATKPVMTLLSEDQFSQLARVVSSTILALTKQTN